MFKILSAILLALANVDAAFDLGIGDDSDLTSFVTVCSGELRSNRKRST
jgi:hypothetical protein